MASCSTKRRLAEPAASKSVFLDTFLVPVSPPPYQPSATRNWDMIHMNLNLNPVWELSQIKGESEIMLSPYFFDVDSLELDAKAFQINKVSATLKGADILRDYRYDGQKLKLLFKKDLSKSDSIMVQLNYTAKPDSLPDDAAGRAIASEKGLFFINPKGLKTSKPRQLWTQGETNFNSRWFPCIDQPNERITHQISVRVEKGQNSLSNGELLFSSLNEDGSRVDVWEMNQPHAPYLVMLAVGDFAQVSDTGSKVPVNYWVEDAYKEEAGKIFGRTPDMINYFSEITGLDYPWPKYDQIVVRDYISGAMENTSAVIHGEFLYHKERELMDTDEEDIIAHELFHHWFGDYVTCESWSNLTLNEGFASYGEYLWREHSKGDDWAQFILMNFKQNYMEEARFVKKPLIRYEYREDNELFDRHSYDKGALVLHMLRSYLGDKAFFAGLENYLRSNAYSSVEIADLRLAFENTTGMDLHWFFDQWYMQKGHPVLEIEYAVKENSAEVFVRQKQDLEEYTVFKMPVDILVDHQGQKEIHRFLIDEEVNIFSIPVDSNLSFISFDPQEMLLAEKHETKSISWLQNELRSSQNIEKIWRNWVQLLDKSMDNDVDLDLAFDYVMKHPSQHLRKLCLEWLDRDMIGQYSMVDRIRTRALEDSSSLVRNQAVNQLLNLAYPEKRNDFIRLCADSSILVSSTAISGLARFSLSDALSCAQSIEKSPYDDHRLALAAVYAQEGGAERIAFFQNAHENINAFKAPQLISHLSDYMQHCESLESRLESLDLLQDYMLNQTVWWQKIVGVDALNALKVQQENIIRNISKEASTSNLKPEEQAVQIQQIMEADQTLEKISAVREALLASETHARIKELMR